MMRNHFSTWCDACTVTLDSWAEWATEQHAKTGRTPSITITFSAGLPAVRIDSSGGQPDPNDFVDTPPKQLSSVDAVHIAIPQKRSEVSSGIGVGSSNAEIAFYLRLKATPGCISKMNHTADVMHLYVDPGSEAAKLFVQRMLDNLRGLRPSPEQQEQARKLGAPIVQQLIVKKLGDGI